MRKIHLLLLVVAASLVAACMSTTLTTSWVDTSSPTRLNDFKKVLVISAMPDETSRRTSEDKLVSMLKGRGMPSYLYPKNIVKGVDVASLIESLKIEGYDGAIVMRLIDVEKDLQYTPGAYSTYPTYYRSFSGYYGSAWGYYNDPGYYSTTKKFSVETNVYSLVEDKMLWTGITESTDPTGVERMTEEIAYVVKERMVKDGFITK